MHVVYVPVSVHVMPLQGDYVVICKKLVPVFVFVVLFS